MGRLGKHKGMILVILAFTAVWLCNWAFLAVEAIKGAL